MEQYHGNKMLLSSSLFCKVEQWQFRFAKCLQKSLNIHTLICMDNTNPFHLLG